VSTLTATATVADVLADLHRDGYSIVPGLLDRDEAAAVRAELSAIAEPIPYGRNSFEGFHTQRIYALFAKTRAFDGPAIHPLVVGVLDEVLRHYQLSAPTGIMIGPGEPDQILHHDDSVYPLPRPHEQVVVTTMWPLDDFTEANGATRLVPGSHRWTDRQPDDGTEVVRAEMPAGSVMFYLGTLWHGGGANRTDRPRLGVILEYVASWLRPQENHILAVAPDVVATLPEGLQELLGYNVYPPFLGYVDGRHPRRLLDR
jgi:ectoine hydroxylase-related dioxygenase (phytanoyl-CoA dioxygenase family)